MRAILTDTTLRVGICKLVAGILALAVPGPVVFGFAASDIHDEIQRVYSFQPHLLTEEQINQKSADLDKFWEKAQSHKEQYVSVLRQELGNQENPPFFFYDGSMLLLKMSDTPQDHKIALQAMARCDLRDVQPTDYFHSVHRLATLGADTTAAAFHILQDAKFQVIVPQHVLTLGQDYALIYMLLPADDKLWLQPAIQRLRLENEVKAQRSLLLLLWYAQQDAADQAIQSFAEDTIRSEETRKYARDLQDRGRNVPLKAKLRSLAASPDKLREHRRKLMSRVSDEALEELDDVTVALMVARRH